MDPKSVVDKLLNQGWTQLGISRELGLSQSTIQRIWSGHTAVTTYVIADGLRQLLTSKKNPR